MTTITVKIVLVLLLIGSLLSWLIFMYVTHDVRDGLLSIWLLNMFTAGLILNELEEIKECICKKDKNI